MYVTDSKPTRIAIVGLLAAGLLQAAHALGLGPITVNSHIGEPLQATIDVSGIDGVATSQTFVGIASNDGYRRKGIKKLPSHDQLNLSLQPSADGYRINVSTATRVREPFITFVMSFKHNGKETLREYTVFLDPPGDVTAKPAVPAVDTKQELLGSAAEPLKPALLADKPASTTTRGWSGAAVQAAAANPQDTAQAAQPSTQDWQGKNYGPVQKGQTLFSIAQQVRPSSNYSIDTVMRQIFRANPRAFKNNRLDSLMAGYNLTIPVFTKQMVAMPSAQVKRDQPTDRELAEERRAQASKATNADTATPDGDDIATGDEQLTEEQDTELAEGGDEQVGVDGVRVSGAALLADEASFSEQSGEADVRESALESIQPSADGAESVAAIAVADESAPADSQDAAQVLGEDGATQGGANAPDAVVVAVNPEQAGLADDAQSLREDSDAVTFSVNELPKIPPKLGVAVEDNSADNSDAVALSNETLPSQVLAPTSADGDSAGGLREAAVGGQAGPENALDTASVTIGQGTDGLQPTAPLDAGQTGQLEEVEIRPDAEVDARDSVNPDLVVEEQPATAEPFGGNLLYSKYGIFPLWLWMLLAALLLALIALLLFRQRQKHAVEDRETLDEAEMNAVLAKINTIENSPSNTETSAADDGLGGEHDAYLAAGDTKVTSIAPVRSVPNAEPAAREQYNSALDGDEDWFLSDEADAGAQSTAVAEDDEFDFFADDESTSLAASGAAISAVNAPHDDERTATESDDSALSIAQTGSGDDAVFADGEDDIDFDDIFLADEDVADETIADETMADEVRAVSTEQDLGLHSKATDNAAVSDARNRQVEVNPEEMEINLDLADSFIVTGHGERAVPWLEEVLSVGTDEQKARAQTLMDKARGG